MLKFGNLEFRNLQEQVEENMKDIEALKSGQAVLDEFGIKVVGEVESVDDMPTVAEYKEEVPDWEYGDAFAVGTEPPYTMYILTRANGEHEEDYWFNIGVFPMPGPQGEQGPQGPEGQQGQTGDTGPAGASAGFGTPTATATMTTRGSAPIVDVTATGPDTEKVFNFDFYLPVATPKVTINSASGSLTLAEYNILHNFEDSVIVFRNGAGIDIVPYTLNRWYESSDYIVYVGLYSYSPYKTGIYRCRVDRSNRTYLLYADEAIKINKYNISTAIDSSTNETAGYVLTADGNGGASWADPETFGSVSFTITTTTGTLSDTNYLKAAGDNCTIIYDDNTTKVSFRKYDETSTTITYAGPFTEGNMTYWYGLGINKAGKTWVMSSSAMPISASNIKSGSYVSGLVLTTNGSGGSSWESLPAPPVLAWGNISGTLANQTDLKNALDDKQDELTEPDTPTGTIYEYLGFTSAGVVSKNTMVPVSKISDIADVAITGSYTDLLNQPSIPDPQVQSNWTQTDNSKVDYIKNKPTLSAVATSGSYTDLTDKPSIPAAQVQSDYTQSDNTAVDYIKNKPDLSIYAQSSSLASVATSGDYDDLLNKPTIPAAQVQSNWNESDNTKASYIQNKPSLASVATSGSYNDLSNKPSIPTVSGSYSGDYWTSINLSGTSKSLVAAGALHYQGTVGSSADITWSNLISSSKSVKAGDFWYVKTARVLVSPTASVGNLVIATTDGTGSSTTWKVVPTGAGTVTSVRVQATSPVQSSVSTAQSSSLNTTISLASAYGDTQNPYGSKTANYVLAAPNGSAGTPSFRALVKADLPTLTASDVGALPDSTVIPDAVSGTNDSTNWTSLTIGTDTYGIPAAQVNSDWDAVSGAAQILNKPSLATVATSGSYSDLTNTPTIPDAVSGTNDGTNWTSLTIGSDTYSIPAGGTATDVQINGTSIVSSGVANILTNTAYDSSTNKIATMSDIPSTSNFVTLDGAQTITGVKTFNNNVEVQAGKMLYLDASNNSYLRRWSGTGRFIVAAPSTTENPELGSDLASGNGGLRLECNNSGNGWRFDERSFYNNNSSTTHNLGTSANKLQDIYLAGNLSDGTNSISVSGMVGKSTVSGTNDGTNWTSLTVNGDTYSIPAGGGGGQTYLHKLILRLHSSSGSNNLEIPIDYYSNSNASMSEYSSNGSVLTNLNTVLTYYGAIGSTSASSLTTLPGIHYNDASGGYYLYYRTGGWGFYRINLTYTSVQQNPTSISASQLTNSADAYALDDVKIVAL